MRNNEQVHRIAELLFQARDRGDLYVDSPHVWCEYELNVTPEWIRTAQLNYEFELRELEEKIPAELLWRLANVHYYAQQVAYYTAELVKKT